MTPAEKHRAALRKGSPSKRIRLLPSVGYFNHAKLAIELVNLWQSVDELDPRRLPESVVSSLRALNSKAREIYS